MPDLNFLPPLGSPFPSALTEPAFKHASEQGYQTEPGPTAEQVSAATPVNDNATPPTAAEIAAAKPVTDTPTPEEVKSASKFFSPEDVARTPVMDLTRDREFSPVSWALRNPDASTDPKVLASLREVYRQRKLAGVTGGDIKEGVLGIPGAIGSLAKAALDRAANLKDIFLRDDASPQEIKAKAESAAALESAGFGAANMARGALQKLAHSNPIDRILNPGDVTLWENMPDDALNKEFFGEVGRAGQAAQTAAGEGELMRWHGGNASELAKRGIVLDPNKIQSLSLTDPLTLLAFEGGFKIVNAASGAVIGTAVDSAAAQSAINAIKSGAATVGRAAVGYPMKAAGMGLNSLGKITEKTGGAGMTIAALKLAEGEFKQAGIIGASAAASPMLKGTGRVLSDMGENLAGGHALGVGTRRLVDLGAASADALANVGKGAALGAATASATGEDAPGMISFGGAFAAPHAAKAALGRVVAGELVQPTTTPYGLTRSPGYGDNAFLDRATADTLAALPEQNRNKINFVRELARKFGGAQVYAYASPEQGAQMVTAAIPGTSPEAAAHAAAQNGFTMEIPGPDGKPRTVIFLNGAADASGHEVGHALEKLLPDEVNQKMDTATRAQFTPEQWDSLGTDYTENLLKRKLAPGESWRDALAPTAGTLSPDTYMMREHRAENFDTLAKNRGSELGAPEDIYRRILGAVGRGAEAVGAPLVQGRSYLGQPISLRSMKAGESALQSVLPKGEAIKPAKPVVRGPAPPPGTPEARTFNAGQAEAAAATAPNTPVAGGTRSPRELLGQISEAIARGTGIKINYLSAPDEPAAATTSNRDTRRAIIEAYRGMPLEARSLWEKSFFPDKVITTKGGEYQIQGWSPEVFASNAHKLAETLGKLGPEGESLSPYPLDPNTHSFTTDGWRQLYVDAEKFVSNQQAGRTGSGETLVVPKEMEARGIFKPQVSGKAAPMDQRTADFLNTLFNFKLPETPRIVKGKVPLNVAGAAVSEATLPGRTQIPVRPRGEYTGEEAARQGIEGTHIQEVNPVRAEIERATAAAGVAMPSMIEAVQKLNLSNIKEVAHAPELPEFRGNTMTLTAGFQPSVEPRAVRPGGEAVRDDETGKIYSGKGNTHYSALHDRMLERFPDYNENAPAEMVPRAVTHGFFTNDGEFLDRKQAYRRALEHGQIDENQWTRVPGELESTSFDWTTRQKQEEMRARGEAIPGEPGYAGSTRFQGTSGAQYQPALPERFAGRPVAESARDIVDMTPDEWKTTVSNYKGDKLGGGLTGFAWDLGSTARTPADLQALRDARDAQQTQLEAAKKAGDFEAHFALAGRGQAIREAYEAATGSNFEGTNEGSAVSGIRRQHDPGYVPPMPAENFKGGQAQPRTRNEDVNKVAEGYLGRALPTSSYEALSEQKAKQLADHYEAASHDPGNAAVRKSYAALAKETEAQYKAIEAAGYTMEPFTGDTGEPYKSSEDMVRDVTENKHLFYLPSSSASDASADNLMMRPSGIEGKPVNDIFSAVHDFFGHAKEGYQFGPRGEYNAWREHSQMYSPEAQGALAAETLAQNAWVNFGPHLRDEAGNVAARGAPGFVPPTERPFAPQKNIVVPPEIAGQAQPKKQPAVIMGDLDDEGRVFTKPMTDEQASRVFHVDMDWGYHGWRATKDAVYWWAQPSEQDKSAVREALAARGWAVPKKNIVMENLDPDGDAYYNAYADMHGGATPEETESFRDRPSKKDLAGAKIFKARKQREENIAKGIPTQTQAQPARKRDEYTMLSAGPGGFTKAWILPGGEVAQLGGMWHHHFLAEDPKGIEAAQKANMDVPPFEGTDTEGVRESALQKGFARVNMNVNNGIMTVEARAADWNKQKSAVRKLVSSNLGSIDQLKVSLLNDHADPLAVDSGIAKLFELDTPAEKLAAIPFINEAPRAARMAAVDNPAFRAPGEVPEAPLPSVYSAPKFAAYDKAGALIGSNYNKYIDAEKVAGTGGSVRILKQIQGQAQPARTDLFSDKGFDDSLQSIRSGAAGGHTFNADGSLWEPNPSKPADVVTLASVNVDARNLSHANVLKALGPYSDLLDEPGIKAGVFSFSKDGKPTISIDINAVVDSKHRKNSEAFAKANDQVAIWDASKNAEVPTGGKGDTRLKSLGEITDALDNLRAGKPVDVPEIIRQNRVSAPAPETADLFGGKRVLSNAEQSSMTKAELAAHFPESVVPRRRDESISSDIRNSPLFKQAGSEDAAVNAFARRLVEFAHEHEAHPGFQSGSKWYSEFVPMLKRKFGADAPIMAELLAATSPQNAPEANYAYAVDALHGLKSGRFDKIRTKYEEGLAKLQDGTWKTWAKRNGLPDATPAAFLGEWIDKFDLFPRQSNGQKYGISSVPVLQVLSRRWLENTSGPKTQNFVKNLLGTGHEATIDLWADRLMRRIGHEGLADRWRILPKNATGVSDADFEFSQKVFREAAKQLKMKPDALQGSAWFLEKHLWAKNGWSRLDLGDYRKEVPKTDALRSGIEQRLARTKALAKTAPGEQKSLDLSVEPRNLTK